MSLLYRTMLLQFAIMCCILNHAETQVTQAHTRSFFTFNTMNEGTKLSAEKIMNLTKFLIRETNFKYRRLEQHLKSSRARSVNYEVGYLSSQLHSIYRKMLDKYITAKNLWRKLYTIEHVIYLEEIEHGYWDILHQANMLHEVERKYGVGDDNVVYTKWIRPLTTNRKKLTTKKGADYDLHEIYEMIKPTRAPWPIDYGWDVKGLPRRR